jgi:hypothetical protein
MQINEQTKAQLLNLSKTIQECQSRINDICSAYLDAMGLIPEDYILTNNFELQEKEEVK